MNSILFDTDLVNLQLCSMWGVCFFVGFFLGGVCFVSRRVAGELWCAYDGLFSVKVSQRYLLWLGQVGLHNCMCICLLFHVIILWLSTRICSDFTVMDCSRECADQSYTCMHAHMHAHAHTHTHTQTHRHTHTHTNTRRHAHMHACTYTHACMYTHTHAIMRTHTHARMHAHTHKHMRAHAGTLPRTHTHTRMHKYNIHNLQAPASVKQVINRGLCWRKMAVQEGKNMASLLYC